MWPLQKNLSKHKNKQVERISKFYTKKKIDFIHVKMWEKEDGVRNFEISKKVLLIIRFLILKNIYILSYRYITNS